MQGVEFEAFYTLTAAKASIGKLMGAFYKGIAQSLMPSGFRFARLCKMADFMASKATTKQLKLASQETDET